MVSMRENPVPNRTARPAVTPYQKTVGKTTGRENMCFCETNPPFSEDFFDATFFIRDTCGGNVRENSVGSFWKTNPPEGCFRGVGAKNETKLGGKTGRRRETNPRSGNGKVEIMMASGPLAMQARLEKRPRGKSLAITLPESRVVKNMYSAKRTHFRLRILAGTRLAVQISGEDWRRGRDSNPRDACAPNGFQDRRNRPLCHLSIKHLRIHVPDCCHDSASCAGRKSKP